MAISVSGTTITFNDATTQTTAATSAPADLQTFTSTGTWTKPSAGQTMAFIQVWGGGGGGGRATNTNASGGGGGGAYNERTVPISQLSTQTVTVGAGGTGATSNQTNGGGGGESWLTVNGARFSAFGGGGGGYQGTQPGGGGGITGAGGTGTGVGGTPRIYIGIDYLCLGNYKNYMGDLGFFGVFHGGGAQGNAETAGGSIYGGGGGTGSTGSAGGSVYGGAGGAGSAGTAPGGGGGCSTPGGVNGSAGGVGRVIITSW